MSESYQRVIDKYKDFVEKYDKNEVWFRGENQEFSHMTPSLFRVVEKKFTNPQYIGLKMQSYIANRISLYEKWIHKELNNHLTYPHPNGVMIRGIDEDWDMAYFAQHIAVPTRFLDWSLSIDVSLYFACNNCKETSILWFFDPALFNGISKGEYSVQVSSKSYKEFMSVSALQLEGQPHTAIYPNNQHSLNPQMNNQKGVFVVFGSNYADLRYYVKIKSEENKIEAESVLKPIKINSEDAKEILEFLDENRGINANSLGLNHELHISKKLSFENFIKQR